MATALVAAALAVILTSGTGCAAQQDAGPVTVVIITTQPPAVSSAGSMSAAPEGPRSAVRRSDSPSASLTSPSSGPTVGSGTAAASAPSPATAVPQTPLTPTIQPPSSPLSTPHQAAAQSPPASAGAVPGSSATAHPPTSAVGDAWQQAAAAAAAAGVSPADPDADGPEHGPSCPADPQYSNEATTGLRSDVAAAWTVTVAAAKAAGVTLCLNDGKRSRAQQQAQFDTYVKEYGEEVAKQLVLPPDKSAHVIGIAVDVQPAAGYQWLQGTAGSLGFCRIYDNEPWHFEYHPGDAHEGCPKRLPAPLG